MIRIILIIFIIVFIILLCNLCNKENFYQEDNAYTDILNIMDKNNKLERRNKLFNSVDNTFKNIKDEGLVKYNKIPLKLLDDYLNKDVYYSNKNNDDAYIKTINKLPMISNNDYSKYNHKLRLLNNSKKIRNDYIITLLQNKLKFMIKSLDKVEDMPEFKKNKNIK